MVDLPLSAGQLCSIIEGVEASLVMSGRVVRVIVSADALRHHFGASLEPSSWLAAFDANHVAVENAAKLARAASGKDTVVLQTFDAAPPKVSKM